MIRKFVQSVAHYVRGFLKPAVPVTLLAAIFLTLTACMTTPEDERLLSARHERPISVSSGSCKQLDEHDSHQQSSWNITGLAPERIAVLNWNIYKENKSGWREDLRKFSEKKDLILLQEAHLDDEFRHSLSERGMYWNLNSTFSYKGAATGVMIASEISPIESCGLQEMEPLLGLPKSALINLYPVAGSNRTLMVANIHGVNFTLGTATYQKQFQALKQMLQDHRGPIILAGDFNNWSDERSAVIENLANELELTPLSFKDDERTTVFNNPIDHIFYRGLDVVANDVHKVESSDHNPITAVFSLQRQLVTQVTRPQRTQ